MEAAKRGDGNRSETEVHVLSIFLDPKNPNYMRIEGKGGEMMLLKALSEAAERIRLQMTVKYFVTEFMTPQEPRRGLEVVPASAMPKPQG